MTVTNSQSGTYVHEISDGIYRISTPVVIAGGVGFSFTESDILGPSEAFRHEMDYFSHTKNAHAMFERLAATEPTTLACMHGSAWRGDGAKLLRSLADVVTA